MNAYLGGPLENLGHSRLNPEQKHLCIVIDFVSEVCIVVTMLKDL